MEQDTRQPLVKQPDTEQSAIIQFDTKQSGTEQVDLHGQDEQPHSTQPIDSEKMEDTQQARIKQTEVIDETTASLAQKAPTRDPWIILCVGVLAAIVILAIGGYRFNWTWTGFRGNTLWDWLKLLILPFALTVVTA